MCAELRGWSGNHFPIDGTQGDVGIMWSRSNRRGSSLVVVEDRRANTAILGDTDREEDTGDWILMAPHVVRLSTVRGSVRLISFVTRGARLCVTIAAMIIRASRLGVGEVADLQGVLEATTDLAVRHVVRNKGMVSGKASPLACL